MTETSSAREEKPRTPHQYTEAWICLRGHRTETSIVISKNTLFKTSSWDLCDRCGESPSLVQTLRMELSIYSQWRKAGIISPEDHLKLMQGATSKNPFREKKVIDAVFTLLEDPATEPEARHLLERYLMHEATIQDMDDLLRRTASKAQ